MYAHLCPRPQHHDTRENTTNHKRHPGAVGHLPHGRPPEEAVDEPEEREEGEGEELDNKSGAMLVEEAGDNNLAVVCASPGVDDELVAFGGFIWGVELPLGGAIGELNPWGGFEIIVAGVTLEVGGCSGGRLDGWVVGVGCSGGGLDG